MLLIVFEYELEWADCGEFITYVIVVKETLCIDMR